jgi:hypothetical protein
MTVESATDIYAQPNPLRTGGDGCEVHEWIERPGGVIADEKPIESKLFGQPGSCQKLPGRSVGVSMGNTCTAKPG